MPRIRKSRDSKLLPSHPKLKLGEYELNHKSSKMMGRDISAMVLEKGSLHLEAQKNPLRIFVEKGSRMKVLFSPKERKIILAHAIKRNLFKNMMIGKLTQKEEIAINHVINTLGKLGEEQLITLLEKQTRFTTKEFITYLVENPPRLMQQQEFDLSRKEAQN
jgi:hypothetical protein